MKMEPLRRRKRGVEGRLRGPPEGIDLPENVERKMASTDAAIAGNDKARIKAETPVPSKRISIESAGTRLKYAIPPIG